MRIVLFLVLFTFSVVSAPNLKAKYEVTFYPPNGSGYSEFFTDKIELFSEGNTLFHGAYAFIDKKSDTFIVLPINCTTIFKLK
ncbi:MAG: hypothetical protein WCW65_02675 [Candidatus Paceibacterota bacterium]